MVAMGAKHLHNASANRFLSMVGTGLNRGSNSQRATGGAMATKASVAVDDSRHQELPFGRRWGTTMKTFWGAHSGQWWNRRATRGATTYRVVRPSALRRWSQPTKTQQACKSAVARPDVVLRRVWPLVRRRGAWEFSNEIDDHRSSRLHATSSALTAPIQQLMVQFTIRLEQQVR